MPPAKPNNKTTPSHQEREAALEGRASDLAEALKFNTNLEADLKKREEALTEAISNLKAQEADLKKREKAVEALAKKVEKTAVSSSASASLEKGEVRIVAKRDGFRRAGMAHPAKSIVHPVGTFDDAQLEQLREENARPNSKLVVEFG